MQHDVRVFNETNDSLVMTLFNNGNMHGEVTNATTGMSLHVDLVNRKVACLTNVSDADDPVYSTSQGNFQWMNSGSAHTFLGYGAVAKLKELDAENNVVLSAQFGGRYLVASYRALKCLWKATPFWKPVVVANRTSDDGVSVFMSWNGATEYDNWAIYTAPSVDSTDTTFISSHDRTGFETMANLSDLSTAFIQVVARQADNILGTSDIISF